LEAVLAEPDVRAADRIVVTGDIAAGPQPVEVLGPLTEPGDRVIRVRGNADRGMVEFLRTGHLATPDEIAGRAARRLRPEQVALLGGLPESVTLEVGDLAPVLFCHATPRNDEEAVPRRLPPGPVGGGARRPGSRGRHGRPRSHAHAVRPVGPWAARGQPRRRRHAVRPPGCPLGAARLRG